jgi:hypothetical protein
VNFLAGNAIVSLLGCVVALFSTVGCEGNVIVSLLGCVVALFSTVGCFVRGGISVGSGKVFGIGQP